jgi:hypothetical protein
MALRRRSAICAVSFVLLLVAGCGGGGGGGDDAPPAQNTPPQTAASGTAAVGAPIAGAQVTLKDSQGTSRTATTGTDGTYSVNTTGLVPPFFLQVSNTGGTLYSVSADANNTTTINITPLTDLIIRSWYNVQGVTVDTAFAAPATNPPPAPAQVDLIAEVVRNVVQLWLDQAGVAADFNLISSPFTANGTGVDEVLDRTSVNPGTGQITITGGGTTQSSTLTATGGEINVTTTTTSPDGETSSTAGTVVPVTSAEQQALSGITAALQSFAAAINTNGAGLQVSHVMPFLDPNLVSEGQNAGQFAAEVVDSFSGGTTVAFELLQIKSLDTTNNVAGVLLDIAFSQGGATAHEEQEFFFTKVGDSWLISGDGRIASLSVQAEGRRDQSGGSGDMAGPAINVHVTTPDNTVTAVTITGGGIWNSATTLTQGATSVEASGNFDNFFINSGTLGTLVPAGTNFTLTLTRADASQVSYVVPSNAFTTELISITSPTGHALSDASLGQPLSVSWTLPTTFAIRNIQLMAIGFNGPSNDPSTEQCFTEGPVLSPTATTAQIIIPATCAGENVVSVNINLSVNGVNGERNQVIYFFQ